MLPREKIFTGGINSPGNAAGDVVNFAEAKFGCGSKAGPGGVCIHQIQLRQSAVALAGAAAMASTISGGRPKRTFSGITSSSSTLPKPLESRNFTTSSTKHSGAEEPAVRAMVFTFSSQSGSMSLQL